MKRGLFYIFIIALISFPAAALEVLQKFDTTIGFLIPAKKLLPINFIMRTIMTLKQPL